jgi:hypothetical protein
VETTYGALRLLVASTRLNARMRLPAYGAFGALTAWNDAVSRLLTGECVVGSSGCEAAIGEDGPHLHAPAALAFVSAPSSSASSAGLPRSGISAIRKPWAVLVTRALWPNSVGLRGLPRRIGRGSRIDVRDGRSGIVRSPCSRWSMWASNLPSWGQHALELRHQFRAGRLSPSELASGVAGKRLCLGEGAPSAIRDLAGQPIYHRP